MRSVSVRTWIVVGLASVLGIGSVGILATGKSPGVALATSSGAAESKLYKPVADLGVIMYHVDKVWEDVENRLEAKKFRTLRKHSQFLAEMMNITGYFDHSEYSEAKGWKEIAGKTRDLLMESVKIAKKKDGAGYTALLKKIEASCEVCHEKYRDI